MSLKNLLYLNKIAFIKKQKRFLPFLLLILFFNGKGQTVNYVANGGFEVYYSCSVPSPLMLAKSWLSIDSIYGGALYMNTCPGIANIPYQGNTEFQYPRSGNAFVLTTFYCTTPACMGNNMRRSYLKNRLKANLQNGKTYCVKFYVNIANTSSYGIDGFGAYFGDNLIDTITKYTIPLTYINPQVKNPIGNVIMDTLGWASVTGTFVANGNEKYLLIGNYISDGSLATATLNPMYLPDAFTDVCIDDVSCIDIDLPAYAGPDISCIPGNSVYIGRSQDVGIDEACTWYNITNTVVPIGVAAGITVSPVVTTTYIVKQDICGNIKWDTVVVHQTALGLAELKIKNEGLKIFPQPAQDILKMEFTFDIENEFNEIVICNSLGQLIKEEEILFKNRTATIKTDELPNGVYVLIVKSLSDYSINRRFIISR